jgi:hypothetical protein
MSHIVTIEVKVRDLEAIRKTCQRMELKEPCCGKARLFQKTVQGILVRLPEWKFPIVIDLQTGNIQYDNYEGNWGRQEELDKFLMFYGAEKAKLEAAKEGRTCAETVLGNGRVMIEIQPERDHPNKTINITFSPGGASRVETTGYTGSGCTRASASVEAALGDRTDEKMKSEYYEETEEEQQQENQL